GYSAPNPTPRTNPPAEPWSVVHFPSTMAQKTSPKVVKVALVEDHLMFREWLGQMLAREPGFVVCGEADNIQQGLRVIQQTSPDIAIVDITLRGSSGLELVKDLKAHGLNVPVLVLSMHDEALYPGEPRIDTARARIKEKRQLRNAAELYSRAAQWVQEHGA